DWGKRIHGRTARVQARGVTFGLAVFKCSMVHDPFRYKWVMEDGSWTIRIPPDYGETSSRNHSVGISRPSPNSLARFSTAEPSAANCVPAPVLLLKTVICFALVRPAMLPASRSSIS